MWSHRNVIAEWNAHDILNSVWFNPWFCIVSFIRARNYHKIISKYNKSCRIYSLIKMMQYISWGEKTGYFFC